MHCCLRPNLSRPSNMFLGRPFTIVCHLLMNWVNYAVLRISALETRVPRHPKLHGLCQMTWGNRHGISQCHLCQRSCLLLQELRRLEKLGKRLSRNFTPIAECLCMFHCAHAVDMKSCSWANEQKSSRAGSTFVCWFYWFPIWIFACTGPIRVAACISFFTGWYWRAADHLSANIVESWRAFWDKGSETEGDISWSNILDAQIHTCIHAKFLSNKQKMSVICIRLWV